MGYRSKSRACPSFRAQEDCAAFAVRANDNADCEILVGAYGLTTGSVAGHIL
jgi:hypothetical protein